MRWSLLLLLMCGCDPPLAASRTPHLSPPRAQINPPRIIGESVNHRPIELVQFGSAGPSILILAAIHGDETSTATLSKNLIAHLQQHPEIFADRRIAIIPVANPDGLAAGTRVNAHGVDCNRNFPASNYRARPRYGREAQSEPETRAVISAIELTNPKLIISIHSIDDGRECNNYDGPAEQIAQLMSRFNGYPATATMGYATPGSLGTYAGIDRKIAVITLELPRKQNAEIAWQKNRDALLAAIEEIH